MYARRKTARSVINMRIVTRQKQSNSTPYRIGPPQKEPIKANGIQTRTDIGTFQCTSSGHMCDPELVLLPIDYSVVHKRVVRSEPFYDLFFTKPNNSTSTIVVSASCKVILFSIELPNHL